MRSDRKLKIVNTSGNFNLGFKHYGPKFFMGHALSVDDLAVNICRDENNPNPCVWLIGSKNSVIDYIYKARSIEILSFDEASFLLDSISYAEKYFPKTCSELIGNVLSIDESDINRALKKTKIQPSKVYINNNDSNTISQTKSVLDKFANQLNINPDTLQQALSLAKIFLMETT